MFNLSTLSQAGLSATAPTSTASGTETTTQVPGKAESQEPPKPYYRFDVKMTCSGCSGAIDRVLKKNITSRMPSLLLRSGAPANMSFGGSSTSQRVLCILAGPDSVRLGPIPAALRRRQGKDRQDR